MSPDVCVKSAHPDAMHSASFKQFDAFLNMFHCIKSLHINILVTKGYDKFVITLSTGFKTLFRIRYKPSQFLRSSADIF